MGITPERVDYLVQICRLCSSEEWYQNAMPTHKVWVDDYYIDKYEVTNSEYQQFVESSGYEPQGNWENHFTDGKENYPVIALTYEDANEYAKFYGKRLPTEAEWEKAAKGGKNLTFPWGDSIDTTFAKWEDIYTDEEMEVYIRGLERNDNCQNMELLPIGSFPPNPFGIFDLGGNAQEMCMDYYQENYYEISPYRNPKGPQTGQSHVMRGASYRLNCPYYANTAYRSDFDEIYDGLILGFRCVYSPTE